MNKKILLIGVLSFLAIGLVTATLSSLFSQETTIDVNQIEINGEIEHSVGCSAGESCQGDTISVYNDLENPVTIQISSENDEGVETSYVSQLDLSQKIVDFSSDVWDVDSEGDTAVVEFTLVGETFEAEVIDGAKEGYELVYYKDNSDRFESPATAIGVNSISGNLAYEDDANNDEYNYCETGEYVTCHGAKIWYIPSDAVSEGNIDWSRADEFLFETFLIQYNSDGEIVVYPGQTLDITPLFSVDINAEEGELTSTTSIVRV